MLQGALDSEVLIAAQRFIALGTPATVPQLYAALQRSNSSLKRRPKKTLEASLDRVLDAIDAENGGAQNDSEAEAEKEHERRPTLPQVDLMNRSLRANLAPTPPSPRAPPRPQLNGNGPASTTQRKANGEAPTKRRRTEAATLEAPKDLSLMDFGGMEDVIARLDELVVTPMLMPEYFARLGLKPSQGVLLHGPPGCGKTMLCRALAAELDKPFIEILGPSVVSGMSGESERALRDRFEEARKNAPCLVFIDEIDAIAPKRETSQSQMEKRIVAQLLVSMDELQKDPSKPVIVLAATNRPDSIDPALRRGGRFGTEINIGVPNELTRRQILEVQTRSMPLASDVDFGRLAKMTAGFVGADLHDLVGKAGVITLKLRRKALEQQAEEVAGSDVDMIGNSSALVDRPATLALQRLVARFNRHDLSALAGLEDMVVSMDDFLKVLPTLTPSSKREGFTTIPDVSWEDIGALGSVRDELKAAIVLPIEQPGLWEHFGGVPPTGILLWGPPGCGKTLLAKACAAESRANFILIKGPELLNKFVGESEAAVRKVFTRARSSAPCIIFFDELDALVPKRDSAGSEASARVVNTMLTELDTLSETPGIYVVGATNRPDIIDDAILRPGRLATLLFVDLPGKEERVEILRALLRKKPCEFTPEIADVARSCEQYSGADLSSLVQRAIKITIDSKRRELELADLVQAATEVQSSVRDIRKYHALCKTFGKR